jgi:arsenate reductase (glutaredoxin)
MKARIYHNPKCSKSRGALALLSERGADLEVIEYLDTPPSREVLERLIRTLGVPALAIVRTREPEFKAAAAAGCGTSDDELLDLLVAHPRLLERPIVEIGGRAVIGRPPERVLDLL